MSEIESGLIGRSVSFGSLKQQGIIVGVVSRAVFESYSTRDTGGRNVSVKVPNQEDCLLVQSENELIRLGFNNVKLLPNPGDENQ